MQIVIDIDENLYTRLFDNGIQDNEIEVDDVCEMARALRLGTPLPKGHGDLIDRDGVLANFVAARSELSCEFEEGLHEAWEIVNSEDAIPAIIKENTGRK